MTDALAGTDILRAFGSGETLVAATCTLLTNGNPDVFHAILLDVDSAGHGSHVPNHRHFEPGC